MKIMANCPGNRTHRHPQRHPVGFMPLLAVAFSLAFASSVWAAGADLDPIKTQLDLARDYMAQGNYASAKIEFEKVLRIDDLPPDLHQQVELYARAAQDYAAGKRLVLSGYGITGYGNYSVNATDGTDEFGGSDTDDNFVALRGGGRANYRLNDDYALNGSLDYRFRDYYDNDDRRDDKDLRWNGAVNRSMGDDNVVVGLRGRRSYRGNGD